MLLASDGSNFFKNYLLLANSFVVGDWLFNFFSFYLENSLWNSNFLNLRSVELWSFWNLIICVKPWNWAKYFLVLWTIASVTWAKLFSFRFFLKKKLFLVLTTVCLCSKISTSVHNKNYTNFSGEQLVLKTWVWRIRKICDYYRFGIRILSLWKFCNLLLSELRQTKTTWDCLCAKTLALQWIRWNKWRQKF